MSDSIRVGLFFLAFGFFTCAVSCTLPQATATVDSEPQTGWSASQGNSEPIQPLQAVTLDSAKVSLGKQLFHDKRLSGDNTVACASCHSLDKGGTDQQVHSTGIGGAQGGINAPTVLNASYNFCQFWNGRASTLEDQVDGPPNNPKEMGSNWAQISDKLKSDDQYIREFRAIYNDAPCKEHVCDAIATFERSLVTVNSPFDKYLKGDETAIDEEQKKGYNLFKSYGCASCHQGANIGGNLFQKFGIMSDYFKDRGTPETDADQGRYAVSKRECDRHVFKVPSLRNLTLTAPYFHDGSATTIPQAVEVMAKYQLGRPIDPDSLRAITRFLESLTGDQPGGEK
jgi:cytochrome c peroxidase